MDIARPQFKIHDHPLSAHYHSTLRVIKDLLSRSCNIFSSECSFPTQHIELLSDQHLVEFSKNSSEYMFTHSPEHGIPYVLVLGQDEQQHPFAVMIHDMKNIYEVCVCASEEYFERGSVFIGWLTTERFCDEQTSGVSLRDTSDNTDGNNISGDHLRDEHDGLPNVQSSSSSSQNTRQVFLVRDSLMIKGQPCTGWSFLKRYNDYFDRFDLNNKDILDFSMRVWEDLAQDMALKQDKIVSLGNRWALQFRPQPFTLMTYFDSFWRSQTTPPTSIFIVKSSAGFLDDTSMSYVEWQNRLFVRLILEAKYVKGFWLYTLCLKNGDVCVSVDNLSLTIELKKNSMLEATSHIYATQNKTKFRLIADLELDWSPGTSVVFLQVKRWVSKQNMTFEATDVERVIRNLTHHISAHEFLQNMSGRSLKQMTDDLQKSVQPKK